MKNINYIFLFLATMLLSCDSDDNNGFPNNNNCLDGTGSIVTEARVLSNFHSISSTVYANIFITQGPLENVRIEAQQNILDELITDVDNGELTIETDRCIDIKQAIKIYVTVPDIKSLALIGVGDIISQNDFTLTEFILTLTGVGNFILSGTTSELDISLTGVGDVKAFDMSADYTNVVISGVGSAEVTVERELDVIISGVGSVYYKGNPTITATVTGSGEVVNAN